MSGAAPERVITLTEWGRASAGPDGPPALSRVFLSNPGVASAANALNNTRRLNVGESRHGLTLQAFQHVGVVRIGPVQVRIQPKMATSALWTALTYALGLDRAVLPEHVDIAADGSFIDLLVLALVDEARSLRRAGVQHGYVERRADLESPRGRPDLRRLATRTPLTDARLPCTYHAFSANIVHNQLVLAALDLSRRVAMHSKARAAAYRAHQDWSRICAARPLSRALLDQCDRQRDRLTQRYSGAHALARFLAAREGIDDVGHVGDLRIQGHLWNMATLFEAFVARFLHEHLTKDRLRAQHTLGDLYTIETPRKGLSTPKPRPDLIVEDALTGATRAVLDTKYRDLWSKSLPAGILYQMSVYALAWSGSTQSDVPAVVLYPKTSSNAHDVSIRLRLQDGRHRRIVLRPIDWARAATLLGSGSVEDRRELAASWVGVGEVDRQAACATRGGATPAPDCEFGTGRSYRSQTTPEGC